MLPGTHYKADEEEWPALPEVKYAPISPFLPTSTSSYFLSSHSDFLWSYFLTSFFILGDDGDELHGDSANNMSETSQEDSMSGPMRKKTQPQ